MQRDVPIQSWCVICRFAGKEEFLFGTIRIRHGATFQEREAETFAALDLVFPTRPQISGYREGAIFFVPDDDAMEIAC